MEKEYDIEKAFRAVEDELIASMMRNMKRHRAEEEKYGFQWEQWQALQLQELEKYKRKNREKFKSRFSDLNGIIEELIRQAKVEGGMKEEIALLKAMKKGYKFPNMPKNGKGVIQADFFLLNEEKLEVLIKATTDDMEKAETAVLRMADDQYRKAIYNAQVYANTGAGTYEKAVDMAVKDFLAAGLNCVEYSNGARHTLHDYADMAVRTASKRAYLQGEGEKRREWGVSTVIMNKRTCPCPKCLPFAGKVLIDDVWSGGSAEDGPYPLMSYAIEKGLYHPRCKDTHTTYFPGISTADDTWTKEELEEIGLRTKEEARQQYAERQAEKYERMAKYSLDKGDKERYELRSAEWKAKTDEESVSVNISEEHRRFTERLRNDRNPSRHKALMALYADMTDMVEDTELSVPFAYVPVQDVIRYNPKATNIREYDMNYVFAHEISHRMDVLQYHSGENKRFHDAIASCQRKVYDNKETVLSWFEGGGRYENSFAISDIISALTDGEIFGMVGHSKEYWAVPGNKELELFANISASDVLDMPEKVEFKNILKELFEAYGEMIK